MMALSIFYQSYPHNLVQNVIVLYFEYIYIYVYIYIYYYYYYYYYYFEKVFDPNSPTLLTVLEEILWSQMMPY